jgi:riboflavin kinase
MRTSLLQTLIRVAELGAKERMIKVSTVNLAASLDLSQQSVSRHLIELERLGFVTRRASVSGMELTITPSGIKELHQTYLRLKAVFEGRPREITIRGRIFKGLGEGAYYVSQPSYRGQFEQILGFKPYPGTLNIRLSPQEVQKRKELETYTGKTVKGFDRRNRSFGDVVCYPATINGINCAIVIIRRTHHDESVLEVIAPVHIRSALNLEEGSDVNVTVKIE